MSNSRTVGPERTKAARAALRAMREDHKNWREVAECLGVNQGLLSRTMNHDYCTPGLYSVLFRMGKVPEVITKEYEPCECGEFHPMSRCPDRIKPRVKKPRQSFRVPLGDIDTVIEKIEKEYGLRLKVDNGQTG